MLILVIGGPEILGLLIGFGCWFVRGRCSAGISFGGCFSCSSSEDELSERLEFWLFGAEAIVLAFLAGAGLTT